MIDIKEYFIKSSSVISTLQNNADTINLICEEILSAHKKDKKLLVAGNGGSCSDVEHFTGELQCTYKDSDRKPISAISLGSHPAALTAWSNDFGYETYFERQVKAHGKSGDILFLISTGGGNEKNGASMNLVHAAKEAKKRDIKIISLLGKTGGLLKNLSNLSIIVENDTTSHIQEAHISILHCICEILDNRKSEL